jgi:hypothetical protein
MAIKDRHRAVIDLLLLERCASEEIVIRLRNVNGPAVYCHASVFRWISEVRGSKEEFRNGGRPSRPYRHESDGEFQSILQEDRTPR